MQSTGESGGLWEDSGEEEEMSDGVSATARDGYMTWPEGRHMQDHFTKAVRFNRRGYSSH